LIMRRVDHADPGEARHNPIQYKVTVMENSQYSSR
jgi:hypothetical protein